MEDISTAAIEVLVQNLINVFKEERALIRGLDQDADQLHTTLGIIKGYLSDAEKKSIEEDSVKSWLRKLEAFAFDADNVLDELSYHLLHNKVKKMHTPVDKVLLCSSSFHHIARPRNMALKIKQITANFESINRTATELGLQSKVLNAPVAGSDANCFETDSITLDPIFIGRDDDVPELLKKLTEFPKERVLSILATVGMGGMGKTTLTRKVFNHERMKTLFGSLIWVHVSQTFDPITLFKKILSILLPSDSSDSGVVETKEVILGNLREALKGKTYLLVLDDVWNEDLLKWEEFMNSISGATSTKGNAIIMTTRTDKVASMVSPQHIHPLKGLSDKDCWSIIKAKAFESGQVPSPGFEMIGIKIAKRCWGLPLAANVVGGVLRSKSEEEWGSINENWLSDDEGGKDILKILKLSYDHLPSPSLKKCFAYCSIFPKGQLMNKQEVIEMWMAEGFLQPNERNEMDSVGNKFINVLLGNSLLLVSSRDDYGNAEWCVMHDLVHDLARSVLGSSRKLYSYKEEQSAITTELAKHLRTLVFEARISHFRSLDFECLHVLILDKLYSNECPSSVRKLIHLRLLDISRTCISNLPEWIGELHHLQILRTRSRLIKKLPSTLKYLINLRHLYVGSDVKLPAEIGRLTCLRTLERFKVRDKKGYRIEELGSLNNLKGKLEICSLDKVHDKEEALKANMFQKPNLFDLTYAWNEGKEGETSDESVLEALQPYSNLKKLRIEWFKGKKFPLWTEKMGVRDGPQGSWVLLNKLIQITLIGCSECEEIPRLDHLPNLKFLYLMRLEKVMFINSSFTNLEVLHIEGLDGLECLPHWLFHNNPGLLELKIADCPKLTELPDGLSTLKSLKQLEIFKCRNLKSIGNNSGGPSQLRELSIMWCVELVELPPQMVESWAPSLEILSLEDLGSLKNLTTVLDCLAKSATRLIRLKIIGVPKFMAICSVESWSSGSLGEINIDVSGEDLSKENSDATKETVNGMLQGCRNSLSMLELKGMTDWHSLPGSIQYLISMEWLYLENVGVEELPEWVVNHSSLRQIYLFSCNKLRRLPSREAFERLPRLEPLLIAYRDCPELCIPSELQNIPNLYIFAAPRKRWYDMLLFMCWECQEVCSAEFCCSLE